MRLHPVRGIDAYGDRVHERDGAGGLIPGPGEGVQTAVLRLSDWLMTLRNPESAQASVHGACRQCGYALSVTITAELEQFSCPECGTTYRA